MNEALCDYVECCDVAVTRHGLCERHEVIWQNIVMQNNIAAMIRFWLCLRSIQSLNAFLERYRVQGDD